MNAMAANDGDQQPHTKRSGFLALGLIGLVLAGATPATAQFYGERYYYGFRSAPMRPPAPLYEEFDVPLNAREVSALLRRQGLRPLTGLRREGAVFITQVETRSGERLRLVIDAYDGNVIERNRLARVAPRPETFSERDLSVVPRREPLPPRQAARPETQGVSPTQLPPPRPDRASPSEKPVITLPEQGFDVSNPAEASPVEAKPVETKPVEARPVESSPVEANPAEANPADTKPAEAKPAEAKPADAKPAEAKSVDINPAPPPPVRAAVINVDPLGSAVKEPAKPANTEVRIIPLTPTPAPVVKSPIPIAPLDEAARPATPAVPVMPLD